VLSVAATETLRLVVADDSVLVREGIARAMSARGFDVVAEVADGDDLVRAVSRELPDVAVADIRMPPTGTDEGLRASDRLAELHPEVAVLILSDHLEVHFATRLLERQIGGRGYLLKQTISDLDRFADAIRRVAAGESVVDSAIVQRVMHNLRADDPLGALTPREREILALMAEGRTNLAIAAHFRVSERTVETHVGHVFTKLGLDATPDDHRRVLAVLAFLRA